MKRGWMTAWALSCGLASTATGQDVEWRAVGAPKTHPSSIVPAAAQLPATPADDALLPLPFPAKADQQPATPMRMPSSDSPGGGKPIVVSPPPAPGPITHLPPCPASQCGPCETVTACPLICGLRSWASRCGECSGMTDVVTWSGAPAADSRYFVSAEFLAWWTKATGVPPLATTSPTPLPATDNNIGAIGRPDTVLLLAGDQLDQQFRPGVRLSAGYWFPCSNSGIDGSIFWTGRRRDTFSVDSTQFPQAFRPFFALNAGIPALGGQPGEFREIVFSVPGGVVGRFDANASSYFWGADLNYRCCLFRGCESRADVFAGFRYLHLDEDLNLTEDFTLTRAIPGAGLPAGTRVLVFDSFATTNDFYGGQVGVDYEFRRNRWSVQVRPSVALGVTRERVCVTGNQVRLLPGGTPEVFTGGLLALDSNVGCRTDSAFAVVPEVTLRLGYQLTDRLKVFGGYNFLYWSDVARPGDQIDRGLDITRIPNFVPPGFVPPVATPRPAPVINSSDFWAQGLTAGVEYRW